MSRGLKIGLGAGAVLVLLAIVIWQLFANLNDIIRAAIETVGSEVTGTEVVVSDVDISLQDGRGTLRGFEVQNPQGFSADNAFQFGTISVQIDTSTLLDEVVVIREVTVDKPLITYELAGDSDNLNTLKSDTQRNAEQIAGPSGTEPAAAGETESGQKFIIERIYLTDGQVRVRATELTDRSLTVPLPDVELRDIGKEQGGADPAAMAGEVMNGLFDRVTRATDQIDVTGWLRDIGADASALAGDAAQAAGDAADAASREAGEAVDAVGRGASDAAEGAGQTLDDAGDAVRGLFGN